MIEYPIPHPSTCTGTPCANELINYGKELLGNQPRKRSRLSGRSSQAAASVSSVAETNKSCEEPDLHGIWTVTNPSQESKIQRPKFSTAPTGKQQRGKRITCVKCGKQNRSVCNVCGESVCSSSVGRTCFALHVADHLVQGGWRAD